MSRNYDAEIRDLQKRMKERKLRRQAVGDLEWRLSAARTAQLQQELRPARKPKTGRAA